MGVVGVIPPILPAASVSGKLEHEEVLAVLNSDLGACPVCSAHCTDVLGTVLMTDTTHPKLPLSQNDLVL